MMADYKLAISGTFVWRTRDNTQIPKDTSNGDYQAYLVWVAAGNTPDPADSAPLPNPQDVADQADLTAFPTRAQIQAALTTLQNDITTLQGTPTNAAVVAIVLRALQRELFEVKALAVFVRRAGN